jgi:hypothetical protein
MHNPQHINPPRNLVNHVKDAVVTNSEPVIRIADAAQAFDPAFALFRGIVLQVSFHWVGNLRGVVFPQCIQVGNSAAFQHDRVGTHSKIVPQLCYNVKKKCRTQTRPNTLS